MHGPPRPVCTHIARRRRLRPPGLPQGPAGRVGYRGAGGPRAAPGCGRPRCRQLAGQAGSREEAAGGQRWARLPLPPVALQLHRRCISFWPQPGEQSVRRGTLPSPPCRAPRHRARLGASPCLPAAAPELRPSLDALAHAYIYMQWLATGAVECVEGGGHHRPNRHAELARSMFRCVGRGVGGGWRAACRDVAGRVVGVLGLGLR